MCNIKMITFDEFEKKTSKCFFSHYNSDFRRLVNSRKMGDASTPSELQLKRLLNILGKFDSYRYEFDKRQHNKQKQSSVIAEWQLIAKVLDIIIGCIFFTVASILSVVCVMMSKHGP